MKILDFGLAALTRDPRLAPKGAVFGTPEYMSPEQARGEDAVSSSDLYALGVLFFEMLTGRLPFRSGDRDELLEMQRKAKAPSPRKYRPEIPEQAEQIILKLLEKKAEDRFPRWTTISKRSSRRCSAPFPRGNGMRQPMLRL